jgi:hypothetical protein
VDTRIYSRSHQETAEDAWFTTDRSVGVALMAFRELWRTVAVSIRLRSVRCGTYHSPTPVSEWQDSC